MAITVKDSTLELLAAKLREKMNDTSDQLTEGACTDFADYRYAVGVIHGLALAERDLLDVDEMLHRQDDD